MTVFPVGDLDIAVRAFINGDWVDFGPMVSVEDDVWTDVWTDVWLGRIVVDNRRLPAQEITITQGRADEGSTTDPASAGVQLWNPDGALTPGLFKLADDTLNVWCPSWARNVPIQFLIDGDVVGWLEAASIDVEWPEGDVSDGDDPGFAQVAVTGAGILRRLGQRKNALRSPLHRLALHNEGDVVGYWPFEDGTDSTSLASGLLKFRNPAGSITGFDLASDPVFAGSDPLPKLSKGSTGSWSVSVPSAEAVDGGWRISRFLYFPTMPTDQSSVNRLLDVTATGDLVRWTIDLIWGDRPKLLTRGFDASGVPVVSSVVSDPQTGRFSEPIELQLKVPGDGTWSIGWIPQTVDLTEVGTSGSGTGTVGHPTVIGAAYQNVASDVVDGHLSVQRASLVSGWSYPANLGWPAEPAASRIRRLCVEEGIPLVIVGTRSTSTKLGVQKSGGFLDLLHEAEASDAGILGESRTRLGLVYRCRRSLYNQSPVLTLDAALSEIANPFTPVTDDQQIRTDVTVERIGGSTYRMIAPGSDSEDAPVYDDSVSLSLDTDRLGTLRNQAGWRLHMGTDLGLRYPQLTFDFGSMDDPTAAIAAWKTVRVGDLIRVVNLPPQHPDGNLDLIVEGWSETFSPDKWTVTVNCSPAALYKVAKWGPGYSKWAPRNATIAGAYVDTDTDVQVSTNSGILFTTDSGQYPFDFYNPRTGEQMTATAGSGASSPQSFTVTRGVNGIAAALSDGDSIELVQAGVEGL